MYLVAAAWLYVALMMALAEATHPGGSVLGAVITFLFYGVGPLALVLYLLDTPRRRRAIRAREAAWNAPAPAANAPPPSDAPDAGRQPAATAQSSLIATEREKP